ncbi:MAG: hypothetical protein B6I23_01205, partial [Rickettsiaceae bacterium 4572_127]
SSKVSVDGARLNPPLTYIFAYDVDDNSSVVSNSVFFIEKLLFLFFVKKIVQLIKRWTGS